MLKRFLLLSVFFILTSRVSAQEDVRWQAVFYNEDTNTFVQVTNQGTTEVTISDLFNLYSYQIALLPAGDTAVFCHFLITTEIAEFGLFTVDLTTGEITETVELDDYSEECTVTVSDDGTQVAVGLASINHGSSQKDWHLLVVDLPTTKVVNELIPADTDFVGEGTTLPRTQYLDADKLAVQLVRWGGEGGRSSPAFEWTFADDTLVEAPYWGSSAWDRLATTGEMVYLNLDPAYPEGQPSSGMQIVYNTVVRRDADGNEEIIWSDPDWIANDVAYLDENSVGVYLTVNMDAEIPNAVPHWIGITREGEVYDLRVGDADHLLNLPNELLLLRQGALEEVQAEIVVPFWQAPEGEEYDWDFIGITQIEE